jgi:hypothetical protein
MMDCPGAPRPTTTAKGSERATDFRESSRESLEKMARDLPAMAMSRVSRDARVLAD